LSITINWSCQKSADIFGAELVDNSLHVLYYQKLVYVWHHLVFGFIVLKA